MTSPLIVVTGATGQLGQTLARQWTEEPTLPGYRLKALDRTQLDLSEVNGIAGVLSELKPVVIVNAAAYTQVDRAETESLDAYLVNEAGTAALASWVAQNDARLIHISTDFVFDGESSAPYLPGHETGPLGAYGASKLAGEKKIQAIAGDKSTIIRTSWLYSEYGNNFVKTMLRLMGAKDELSVVDDQVGSPTSTHGLANLIFAMIRQHSCQGIYHWTDGGNISWFEFAQEIQRQALQEGLLNKAIPLKRISSSEYPTAARRPPYSVLDRSRALADFECPGQLWKEQLAKVIQALATH
jgi:dTDP-4-dehydrorhamnose reductase